MKYKEKEIEFTLSLSLADLLAVPGCSIHSLDPHWLMYIRRRFPFAYSAELGVRCALTKKKNEKIGRLPSTQPTEGIKRPSISHSSSVGSEIYRIYESFRRIAVKVAFVESYTIINNVKFISFPSEINKKVSAAYATGNRWMLRIRTETITIIAVSTFFLIKTSRNDGRRSQVHPRVSSLLLNKVE